MENVSCSWMGFIKREQVQSHARVNTAFPPRRHLPLDQRLCARVLSSLSENAVLSRERTTSCEVLGGRWSLDMAKYEQINTGDE